MSKSSEKFLEAEKTALELAATLSALKEQMRSYEEAAYELNLARQRLVEFVSTSEQIAENTKKAVEVISSIGGPEIFAKLDGVSADLAKGFDDVLAKISTEMNQSFNTVTNDLAKEINTNLSMLREEQKGIVDHVEKKHNELAEFITGKLQSVRTLIVFALLASVVGIVISILSLMP